MFFIIATIIIIAIIMIWNNKREETLSAKVLAKAEQGDAQSQFDIYQMYKRKNSKLDEAVQFLVKSAKNGYAQAQFVLGLCYKEGTDVEKNLVQAAHWIQQAAEQGLVYAQNELGYCYMMGYGVEADDTKSFNWFEKAAEQGDVDAQYNVGVCYLTGKGVKEDRNKAIDWCKKADENGSSCAGAIIGFRTIEETVNKSKSRNFVENYNGIIKTCCIKLVKKGYKLRAGDVNKYDGGKDIWITLYVYNAMDESMGSIQLSLYNHEASYTNHHLTMDHLKYLSMEYDVHHIIQLVLCQY